MHILRDSILRYERLSPFFFSRSTKENTPHGSVNLYTTAIYGIFTKLGDSNSLYRQKSVVNNSRVILLLITLLMVSGIVIPFAQAADSLIVDFNAVPIFGVRPLDVQFQDATIAADPANNTYLWAFGDGNTSTEINPPHTYNTSGIFTVNLTVTEISSNNSTLSKPFYIHVGDAVNTSDFSGTPRCGLSPLPVQFIDASTLAHDQWEWTFGDGGTSNLSDPLYIYYGEGSWNVSLYISNSSGGPQSIIRTTDYIRVIPVGVASFTASGTIDNSTLTVQFNDTSTGFVSPVTYAWNFGDNTTSPEQNPSHTYANSSMIYTVALTVTGYCWQTMTSFDSLTVSDGSVILQPISVPRAPVVDFTGTPTSGSAPLNVSFSDLSINNPVTWNWSFGDGTFSILRDPVHTYALPGNYTVSLTVANPRGSSTKTLPEYITVSGFHVTDFIGSPTFGSSPLTVQFTDISYGFKEPVTYLWDFGDGGTSTMRNASHTYTTTGYHSVSLTVSDSRRQTVTVIKPGYISTEISVIELVVGDLSQDPSILSNDSIPPVQSTPLAESLPIGETKVPAQSFLAAQSLPQDIPVYRDLSILEDISSQNELSASNPDPIDVKQPSIFWPLNRSINNTMDHAFWMMIKCTDNWTVRVYDAEPKDSPEGRMAVYNFSQSTYVTPNIVLSHPLKLRSEAKDFTLSPLDGPVELSAHPGGILQEGPPFNSEPFKYFINLEQYVDSDDQRTTPGNQYRVVITFEAQPQ
jgi:PKD repeat protein